MIKYRTGGNNLKNGMSMKFDKDEYLIHFFGDRLERSNLINWKWVMVLTSF
jgi:hypothetical protein